MSEFSMNSGAPTNTQPPGVNVWSCQGFNQYTASRSECDHVRASTITRPAGVTVQLSQGLNHYTAYTSECAIKSGAQPLHSLQEWMNSHLNHYTASRNHVHCSYQVWMCDDVRASSITQLPGVTVQLSQVLNHYTDSRNRCAMKSGAQPLHSS